MKLFDARPNESKESHEERKNLYYGGGFTEEDIMKSITLEIIANMGFIRTLEFEGEVYAKKYDRLWVLITILSDGKWRPQLLMEDNYESHFILYDLQNIKDLTDLSDFISYL